VSFTVHALLSEQAPPAAAGGFWQPSVALHESVVHGLPSLQLSGGVVARQNPVVHASTPLQTFPSEHDVPSATG